MTTSTLTNPVPKCISSLTYTNSIGVSVLRRFAPQLADEVEVVCEQVTARIDRVCERVLEVAA